MAALLQIYGLEGVTDPNVISKKFASYILLHFKTAKGWVDTADQDWNGGKYEKTG